MAEINYLITGISGTGKTAVCDKLQAMGYNAVDADTAFSRQLGPEWLWDEKVLGNILEDKKDRIVFICGNATNRRDFIKRFDKAFMLYVDDATLTERLAKRTNNPFGKLQSEIERMLAYNHEEARLDEGNKVFIDAARPVDVVVNDILSLCNMSR